MKIDMSKEVEDASSLRLPKGNYTLRCINAEVKNSRSTGLPMIESEWEVVGPASVPMKGADGTLKDVDVRGVTFRHYLSTSPGGLKYQFKPMHTALGLSMDIDTEALNPELYKGQFLEAICSSESAADMSEAGTPLVDANGAAIIRYQHRIERPLKKGKPVDNLPY